MYIFFKAKVAIIAILFHWLFRTRTYSV